MILTDSFIRLLRHNFRLDWDGLHGAPRWTRVRDHGLKLATEIGADIRVVEYFAFRADHIHLVRVEQRRTYAGMLAGRIHGKGIDHCE